MADSSISITGRKQPFVLIVEPWADEFKINPDDKCLIVVTHPQETSSFSVEWHADALAVFPDLGDTTFNFWRNGLLEFSNQIPCPGPLNAFGAWRDRQGQK